jgi:hypothetical protein
MNIADKLYEYEESISEKDSIRVIRGNVSVTILKEKFDALKVKNIDWIEESFKFISELTPMDLSQIFD